MLGRRRGQSGRGLEQNVDSVGFPGWLLFECEG